VRARETLARSSWPCLVGPAPYRKRETAAPRPQPDRGLPPNCNAGGCGAVPAPAFVF